MAVEIKPIEMQYFDGFYQARKALLLRLVEQAMGKVPLPTLDAIGDSEDSEAVPPRGR